MEELGIKAKEKECKETEADLHSSTSQLIDLIEDDVDIENDCCKKEANENITFEKSLVFLVKNSKHSKMKEEITEESVADEPAQSVADEEENGISVPSEHQISDQLIQSEGENENICNKAWWNSGIGSESQTSDLTLHHLGSKPPNDCKNTWKICSSKETELDSEKSEVLKELAKKFNRKECPEEFNFKADEVNHLETEPLEDKKRKRKSSNSGHISTSDEILQYSRDQLLMLMSAPASRAWPEYFDIAFKKPEGKMDLEKWVKAKQEGKFNASTISVKMPSSSGTSNSINSSDRAPEQDTKRSSKDPRERIKQELHGGLTVVLSPQRKSFSTGCHVTQQSSLNIGKTECNIDRSRELPVNRRIGSGRIARREDHEQLCQNDNRRDHRDNDKDVDQRRDKSGWRSKTENISSGNNRFDRDDRPHLDKRRRFFDDDDKRNERRDFRESRDRRYNNNHRRTSVSKDIEEETPEWFTGGPSSQNEYIELVGFDEPDKDEVGKQKVENVKLKKEREVGSRKNSRSATPVIVESVIDESESEKPDTQISDTAGNPIVVEPSNDQNAFQFNVEDYIGSILNFGPEEMFQCSSGGSRLKQFFNSRESPVEEAIGESHSKRSSPGRDGLTQLGNLIGFAEPVIRVPSSNAGMSSSHFFTPISPADKTSGERGTGDSLVEMLQKASASNTTTKKLPQQSVMPGSGRLPPPSIKDLIMEGKGQSLEEIEANLRRGRAGGQGLNMGGGHCSNTQFNQQLHHGFHTNKPPPSPLRPNQQLHSQQNPFSDLLMKNGNVPSAGPVGSKPPILNNSTSENEFLAKLIRGGGIGTGSGAANSGANMNNSNLLSLNVPPSRPPPPPIANLNLAPPHNLTPANAPSLPQHSPSRSHLMPQQQLQHSSANSSDVFLKLMQNQQHKKHLLHPGFPQQQQQQQQSQQSHLDPIKQLLGGMNNISINSQQNQDISRDVHNLFQRVATGQVTDSQLIAQLSSGNLTLNQREAVTTVLKLLSRHQNSTSLMPPRANLTPSPTPQAMMGGGLSLANAPPSLSPRVASPNPDAANMLAPHMIQQARVSPLMFGSGTPRRPPSHQELVVHAQSILQKALLKNELERAKEKHRKREAAERTRSPNPPPGVSVQNGPSSVNSLSMNRPNQDCSPTKGSKCQSPLVFTPISVLRKMTAEKDRSEKEKHEGYGMTDVDKARDSQNRLSNHQNSAIHAGSVNLKNEKKSSLPSGNSMLGPRAQMVMSGAQTTSMMHLNPHVISSQRHLNMPQTIPLTRNPQQNIRVMQPQQQNPQMMRATMQQHMNNMNTHPSMHSRMQNPQNHIQNMSFGNSSAYKTGDNSLNVPKPVGSQNSSPINFMNFFGRDVLAKVQAGGMPELPGGKALSLEEVERQQTQAVPN